MAEIIAEPSALSKIIPVSFKINDTDSVTTTRLATKKQFNTTDTDAWLSFTLEGIDASMAGEYDLTMINVDENPSSIVNHTNIAFSGIPFHYKMDSSDDLTKNEIRHAGRWMGQVVVRLTNGDTTTRQFDFAITGHLLDGKEARLILIEDYNALMATITTSKDELAQYNIDYAALIETVTTQEAARVQAELTRAQTFDALVESEMIAQNVATKLTEKEATYAPRLLSAEQQLEVEKERINTFTTLTTGSTTGDAELIDTRIGADGKTYQNAGGAVRGQITDIKNSLTKSQVALDLGIVWEAGYISAGGTRYDSDTSWLKTNTLTFPKGYKLEFTSNGYGANLCSMIAKVNGDGTYTPLVKSRSGNAETYEYIFKTDTDVILSRYNDSYFNVTCYQTIVNRLNSNFEKIINLELSQMYGKISTDWEVGYISPGGTRYDSDTSWLKTPVISIKTGKTIEFTANGYRANLCSMIAKVNGDGTYTPLVKSRSGNVETYTYTFDSDTDVILSCVATSAEKTVVIKSEWASKIESLELETSMSFSMFEKWGVIGDSFASGVFYDDLKGALDNHLQKSWGQILARKSGNVCINFSMGGLTTGTWLTQEQRGLPLLLTSAPQELYVLALGINDVGRMSTDQPLGTIADIKVDFSQNPYTFYGNYGKIIDNIKIHAPKAKIVMSTIPYNSESAMAINNAIIAIAAHYNLPCLPVHTDTFFRSTYYWANFEQDHPKSFIYSATANAYERLICDDIKTNTTYWGNVFN